MHYLNKTLFKLNKLLLKLKNVTLKIIILSTILMPYVFYNQASAKDKLAAEGFVIALTGQYKALASELQNNQFKRPLVLKSNESPDSLKGEIYAVLDYPFAEVNNAINNPDHWCDALILHINVKYCRAVTNNSGTVLNMNLGKKYDQPLAETYKAKFNYESITTAANYFSVEMKAADGPLGTKDYRIWVEATPVNNNQTFLHFTYAYSFGFTGRLAMKGYLATIGKDKIGFSTEPNQANGAQNYIQGVRSVVERNTMRYYLAIDAYLAALKESPENQQEKRFDSWYDGTEQFAKQLHEVEKNEYLTMKRKEAERQRVK
ncbi:MAG: hypothetical protein H7Z20_04560 [Bdellovibrio sp.]|nr:hypothetical protein [Methylotenera sp.]